VSSNEQNSVRASHFSESILRERLSFYSLVVFLCSGSYLGALWMAHSADSYFPQDSRAGGLVSLCSPAWYVACGFTAAVFKIAMQLRRGSADSVSVRIVAGLCGVAIVTVVAASLWTGYWLVLLIGFLNPLSLLFIACAAGYLSREFEMRRTGR
jgi:hypothetical protein